MTQKIAGNWQFEKILGSGGFGQVELWREKFCSKRIGKSFVILIYNPKAHVCL